MTLPRVLFPLGIKCILLTFKTSPAYDYKLMTRQFNNCTQKFEKELMKSIIPTNVTYSHFSPILKIERS